MKTRPKTQPGASPSARRPKPLPTHWRRWLAFMGIAGLLAILASLTIQRTSEPPIPAAPTRYLDDRAGLLSPEFVGAKEQYIEHLSRTMRIAQIGVVIWPGAPSGALEDFTIRAASSWKVGAGGVDNGLLLFIFPDQHQMRLEVGYGLESVISDALAHRLLEEQLVPAFARGEYEKGIEDFLDVLDKTLESSEAANHRAAPYAAMLPFVMNVLGNAPRFGAQAWQIFLAADRGGRVALSLFGVVLLALLVRALLGIAAGIPPLLLLPWRLYSSESLRTIQLATLKEQFAWRNCATRPPPFLTGLFDELELGAITNAFYLLAAIVVGIAFLFVGWSALVGGAGQFGGAGATLSWPAP